MYYCRISYLQQYDSTNTIKVSYVELHVAYLQYTCTSEKKMARTLLAFFQI